MSLASKAFDVESPEDDDAKEKIESAKKWKLYRYRLMVFLKFVLAVYIFATYCVILEKITRQTYYVGSGYTNSSMNGTANQVYIDISSFSQSTQSNFTTGKTVNLLASGKTCRALNGMSNAGNLQFVQLDTPLAEVNSTGFVALNIIGLILTCIFLFVGVYVHLYFHPDRIADWSKWKKSLLAFANAVIPYMSSTLIMYITMFYWDEGACAYTRSTLFSFKVLGNMWLICMFGMLVVAVGCFAAIYLSWYVQLCIQDSLKFAVKYVCGFLLLSLFIFQGVVGLAWVEGEKVHELLPQIFYSLFSVLYVFNKC